MDMSVFFANARHSLFKGKMTAAQVKGCERLLAAWEKYGYGLDTGASYILATSYWETGQRMQPVRETHATTDAQAIKRLDKAFAEGKLKWVKTPYWRTGFFGRGDVQLTHESNYKGPLRDAVKKLFGVDIHADRNKVLDPEISAFILVEGVTKGETTKSDFTAHSLEQFINERGTDYASARKTVNPGEASSYQPIAEIAKKFEEAIRAARAAAGQEFRGPVDQARNIYDGGEYPEVKSVQKQLDELGYPEVGKIDGRWGSKTAAAILAFRHDNGLPTVALIDGELAEALLKASPRQVSVERGTATLDDLRAEGAKDVEKADKIDLTSKVLIGGGVIGAAQKAADAAEQYSQIAGKFSEALAPFVDVISDNFFLIAIGVGGYVIWNTGLLKRIRLEKHRTAQDVSA